MAVNMRTDIAALVGLLLLAGSPGPATVAGSDGPAGAPPTRGSAATWLKLQRLCTTASVLHSTAHPDDEQGGLLAWLAHGHGVRTGLLTLNRGEAGDNALGAALFDALGLLRTEELHAAGAFYGLDAQYYTLAADYGFSKRLDEALEQWDRDAVLRDMVRAIRTMRPLVVISRWQGNARDGHGQHQAAGALTPEAVRAAGDPARYPELAREGLRPWRVRKLFMGGVRAEEPWTVRIDTGEYSAALGDTYQNIGRRGLSYQRSQNGGRFVRGSGPAFLHYRTVRLEDGAESTSAESSGRSFFEGIDTSLLGIYAMLGAEAPPGGLDRLKAIASAISDARSAFGPADPAALAPHLARALRLTRQARDAERDEDVRFLLAVKERELVDTMNAAIGIELEALAVPPDAREASGPAAMFAPPPTLGPLTPGQACQVRATLSAARQIEVRSIVLESPRAGRDLTIETTRAAEAGLKPGLSGNGPETGRTNGGAGLPAAAEASAGHHSLGRRWQPGPRAQQPVTHTWRVIVKPDAEPTRPYFERSSIADSHYTARDPALVGRPSAPPLLTAVARYAIDGTEVPVTAPVVRRESNLPYGERRELEVLPAVTLSAAPRTLIVRPKDQAVRDVYVDVTNEGAATSADVSVAAPAGWTIAPPVATVSLNQAEHRRITFSVQPPLDAPAATLTAQARVGDRTYTSGYEIVRARDLPLRYLTRDAHVRVQPVDVSFAPGLRVGYVMGVGDEVPAAIDQLGATVTLLGPDDLATGDLGRFDTIVTGTRAYAVRADLRTHNQRLLEYVKHGGNLVVLYNTPELVPGEHAPFPAELPADSEEICEERAPVEILAPEDPLMTTPNRITAADFDGWIEQRGSKFFSTWDQAYTPLLSSHDRDQPPQRGGMLHARYGKGHYTYMAYALHRQLPGGVPGAYRLLANLLSVGRR
jgi:LmbE family N-acetylglucosaminyl deacetylase